MGCVSQDLQLTVFSAENRNRIRNESHRQSLQKRMAQHQNSGKKESVHREELCISVNLKNEIRVRLALRIRNLKILCNKNDAPAQKAWDLARTVFWLKARDKTTFYAPTEEFIGKTGALFERARTVSILSSMHIESKQDSSPSEQETLRKSKNTTT